ncbi:MAG: T9SS type A sorting domain-containing protein [Ignavibacteriaceae bacterium]|nr:T9SS type A sorting domain-containing protein [Ignavibacteriaceae bacterium]
MRTKISLCILASLFMLLPANIFSQSNGDFRSHGQGKWNSAATWQTYNGTTWVAASAAPTGSENITLRDSVDVNISITITGEIVDSLGGKLGNSSTNLTFGNNGVYEHAINAGSVPSAAWGPGSTCLFTAVKDTMPSNCNQNFYNFSWKCPNNTTAVNLSWNNNTIGGNVNVIQGNINKTYLRLTDSKTGNSAPKANVITINGDINLLDTTSVLTSTGSSGGDTIEIHVKGNITSHGILNLANGSGAACNWYLSGDLNLQDGSMTTNSSVGTLADTFFFVGTTKQTFYKADSLGSISNVNFIVSPGAIVDLTTTSIGGSTTATFTQSSGTTLMTSHNRGLSGNLSMQGLKILPKDGNYLYHGITSQIDSLVPTTVNNLTIDNPDTVSFSKADTVNGVLTLKQGLLNNSVNPIVIGTNGSVVYAGGHTAVPIQGWPEGVKNVSPAPRVFKLFNNYPNPFNPSTIIRFTVPKDGFTSLKVLNILGQEVTTLFEGNAKSGNMLEVTFDARNRPSGIYFARLQQGDKVSIQKMNLIK